MALFGRGNIRRKVMEAVEAKIAQGQQDFEEEVRKEEERLADGIRALTDAAVRAKDAIETRIVSSITN